MLESVGRQIVALVGQQNFPKSVIILKKSHNCSEITFIYCVLETYRADFAFLLFIAHNFK